MTIPYSSWKPAPASHAVVDLEAYLQNNCRTDPIVWEFVNMRHKAYHIMKECFEKHGSDKYYFDPEVRKELTAKLEECQKPLLDRVVTHVKSLPPYPKPPEMKRKLESELPLPVQSAKTKKCKVERILMVTNQVFHDEGEPIQPKQIAFLDAAFVLFDSRKRLLAFSTVLTALQNYAKGLGRNDLVMTKWVKPR